MKYHQNVTLTSDPVDPMDATTKRYVDNMTGGVVGGLFATDITPTSTGIVGSKTYVLGTTPANAVIASGTSDTNNVRVSFVAEPNSSFYSPTITYSLNGGPAQPTTLNEKANDTRLFTGFADIVIPSGTSTVTLTSSTGATTSVTIIRAGAGPAITALTIGALPGSQTTVKSGDVVQVSGVVENAAVYAEIIAGGAAGSLAAMTLGGPDSGGVGFKSFAGTFTVGSGTGVRTVTARARNTLGTFGANFVSTNSVTLDQAAPVIGSFSITYPGGQQGLKGSESATVTATVTDFTSITYSGTNLSITAPTTYAASKTATRTGGTYSFGTNNYTITAVKASNGTQTVASTAVTIADTPPTAAISITGNPARLLSSPTGQDYTVVITANQRLLSAPSLVASSGTWQGSWTGSGTTWSRVLRITDADPKGAQTFSTLSLTGLAGVTGSVITAGSTYNVGGFIVRTVFFAPFSQIAAIGTSVQDINKTTASYSGTSTILALRNNTADFFQGYTITNAAGVYDPNGTHVFITDQAFAGSNTTGTLAVDIAESV